MRLNQNGVSLVEALVGIGLMSLISLGMASMLSGVSNQVKIQESKLNVISSKGELMANVQGTASCTSKLAGQTISNGSALTIGGYTKGAKINNRVNVEDIIVSNVTTIDATTGAKSANVEIQFRDAIDSNIIYKPLEFVLYYSTGTAASNTLVNCGGSGTVENLIANCNSMGGSWNGSSSTCDINSPTCNYLGGTLNPDGSCTDLPGAEPPAPPAPTYANCTGKTFSKSDSIYTRTQTGSRCLRPGRGGCMGSSIKYYNVASSCTVSTTTSGAIANGTCNGKSPTGGSCRYLCNDGSWSLVYNDCNERE